MLRRHEIKKSRKQSGGKVRASSTWNEYTKSKYYQNNSTHKIILDMLAKKGINTMVYSHFIEGKENLLNGILEELNAELEAKEDEKIKIEEQK